MIVNMRASTQLCSFDGSHIVSTRLDGSLFMQFNDGKRYGMAYFSDPYKKNMEDISKNAIGIKLVVVNKNHIVMVKNYDNMYLGIFDLYKMNNVTKVDDIQSIGHPELNWECKINPFKKQNEMYLCIIFLNDDYILFLSQCDETEFNEYIYNIKTDKWININLIEQSNDNWIEQEKVFIVDRSKNENNFHIIFLHENIIKKKYINVPDIKNIGVSSPGKMLSKFDNITNTLSVISYQKIYDLNLDYTSYPIKFMDDKEFYTDHNITEKAFIVTTNKNIYIKFIEDDLNADWVIVDTESFPKDTYIINDEKDEFIDTCSIFWNGIIVNKYTCVLTTLAGDTYILYNIKKDKFKITKSQLPQIFCGEEYFNITFGKEIFGDKFDNKYKIQYFQNKTDDVKTDDK
jgi:hypothetical protein